MGSTLATSPQIPQPYAENPFADLSRLQFLASLPSLPDYLLELPLELSSPTGIREYLEHLASPDSNYPSFCLPNPLPLHFLLYTPTNCEFVLATLRGGGTHKSAAAKAKVPYKIFAMWYNVYPWFQVQVEIAEGIAEQGMTDVITLAAKSGDWKAAETWLKRRRRADWGDNVSIETDSEIDKLLRMLNATPTPTSGPDPISLPPGNAAQSLQLQQTVQQQTDTIEGEVTCDCCY